MALTPKQIGRSAGRIFQSNIPLDWAYRPQEDQEDYGVDAEIELIGDNEKATGIIFKAQIKGQENVNVINEGETISFSLSIERLSYYMGQLDLPIILVVVDVTTKIVYWCTLQDNHELGERLAKSIGEGKKYITIHIPSGNTLPEGSDKLLKSVMGNLSWLKINALNKINTPIHQMLKNSPSKMIDELIQRNKEFNFYLYIEQYDRLLKNKSYEELFDKARVTFESTSELFNTRFNSALYIEQVYLSEVLNNPELRDECLFYLYSSLTNLVREEKMNAQYRMYVVFLLRAFITNKLIETDYHVLITKKNTEHDALTSWMLLNENNRVVTTTARHVEKIIYAINKMILYGNEDFFVDAISRVAIKLGVYSHRLKLDELTKSSEYLLNWLDYCLNIAIEICKSQGNDALHAKLILIYVTIRVNQDDYKDYIEEAKAKVKYFKDEEVRNGLIASLEKISLDKSSYLLRNDPDLEIDFFTSRAKQLGFKIDDADDEIGQIIKQGLLDYNPERIVKNCEHLLMFASRSLGIPARMVGLYSASTKYLVCTKKNHIMGGWRLDDIYNSNPIGGFKDEFCANCNDNCPRSPDWKWTSAWQQEKNELHKELLARLDRW
ncbi:DUF4365 domain-containing protein [Pantoea sp. PNT02]|uniref:DUF4365 domain-containing protein n=1 Tax=Pantoea sp. PNT02 TaxID=2769261 RepID=UPI00177C861A|nr:DUF4365 domain-containing protein [Pantoea sp. PNT02]MBD9642246.1 DUF4365 domain-containing protein [Pantoea sp. PNT02]